MFNIAKKINEDSYLLEQFLNIMEFVSNEIINIYESNNFELEIKNDNSPLTLADKRAHEILSLFLNNLDLKLPVISEENYTKSTLNYGDDPYWLIDPLDGTKEFIAKNGEFTINVALIENRRSTYGFVSIPCKKEIYWGGECFGSWKKNKKKNIINLKVKKFSENMKIAVSRSHLSQETKSFLNNLPTEYELLPAGSSLKFLMIAEGKADLYPRLEPTSEWDTAAAHAILEGAGGKIVNIDNYTDILYSKECIKNPFFLAFGDKNILKTIA